MVSETIFDYLATNVIENGLRDHFENHSQFSFGNHFRLCVNKHKRGKQA